MRYLGSKDDLADLSTQEDVGTVYTDPEPLAGSPEGHLWWDTDDEAEPTAADELRRIDTDPGLVGGGDLTVNRVLAPDWAADGESSATKIPRANDSRLSNSRTPSGAAGGDLAGTYPNPTIKTSAVVTATLADAAVTGVKIATGVVTDTHIAAANKDGAAATASMRTLGTGATQAAAGDHTHTGGGLNTVQDEGVNAQTNVTLMNFAGSGVTAAPDGAGNVKVTIPGANVMGGVGEPGEVTMWGSNTPPDGWMVCDGSAISRTVYAALFAVIGTSYGTGDGSTTFNIPNLKGRTPVGRDSAQTEFDVLGETGGAKTHTLTLAQMPAHSHGGATGGGIVSWVRVVAAAGTIYGEGNHTVGRGSAGYQDYSNVTTSPDHTHTIASEGSGAAHNILQPYQVLNFIIRLGQAPVVDSGEYRTVGEVIPFTGAAGSAPAGWLNCDGSAVSRSAYAELFAVVGTTYGAGDGSTTFNLPNFKGRVPVGLDSAQTEFDALGETGGAKTHLLTAAESGLTDHVHALPMAQSGAPFGTGDVPLRASGGADGNFRTSRSINSNSPAYGSGTTNSAPASQAHNNLQPYLVVNYLIRAVRYIKGAIISQASGQSARVATTANITLSGLQTIDGVALNNGDPVLVWRQTTTSQNGVYIASSGAWIRHPMWDTTRKVAGMKQVNTEEGTKYGGCKFETVDWKASNTLGTTGMIWTTDIIATAQNDTALVPFQSWADLSLGETYDPQGIYASPVYTIPFRGLWEVEGAISWSARAAAANHLLYAAVLNNTIEITRWSAPQNPNNTGQGSAGTATFVFNANDTIKFRAYQDGTNGNLTATYPTSRVRLVRAIP